MAKIFLDTNVLLDHLAARTPFDQAAKKSFNWLKPVKLNWLSVLYLFVTLPIFFANFPPAPISSKSLPKYPNWLR